MTELVILLAVSFFFIAIVYSSVGFGGGSSYLAILALVSLPVDTLRPVALLCNIIVATGGVMVFAREGILRLKQVWHFLLPSVPLAFLGGYWQLHDRTFFLLLGTSLVVASALLWIRPERLRKVKSDNVGLNTTLGGTIGLLSGVVSIGGGIFLSPVLHLIDWDEAKKISAMASVFILANSVSGLAGQWLQLESLPWSFAVPLLLAVLAGGQVGSRLGARVFNSLYIKRITAVVVFIAGLNILRLHF